MPFRTIKYLARDELYQREKPYSTELQIEGVHDSQRSNYRLSEHSMDITSIENPHLFELEVHGFCIITAPLLLSPEDALMRPGEVEERYMSELGNILLNHFQEYSRLEPIDFVVRKRDERFPSNDFVKVTHQQPTPLAHADYSMNGALMQLEHSFPGQGAYFNAREFDMINVWRPLVGPNNDWPLGICDFTSIDTSKDIATADLLYANRIGENQLLFHGENHRWYYMRNHLPEDMIVFRNIDSTGTRARAFHCAFNNPDPKNLPRTSCEVRFVAFR